MLIGFRLNLPFHPSIINFVYFISNLEKLVSLRPITVSINLKKQKLCILKRNTNWPCFQQYFNYFSISKVTRHLEALTLQSLNTQKNTKIPNIIFYCENIYLIASLKHNQQKRICLILTQIIFNYHCRTWVGSSQLFSIVPQFSILLFHGTNNQNNSLPFCSIYVGFRYLHHMGSLESAS